MNEVKTRLFVVGVGRSGTTLLQRILNAHDEVHILGENNFVLPLLETFSQFERELLSRNKEISKIEKFAHKLTGQKPFSDTGNPWYGINRIDASQLKTELIELLNRHFMYQTQMESIVGFKEIRWHLNPHSFEKLVEFYPNTKFIFNFRNSTNVSESSWWRDYPDPISEINRIQEFLENKYESLKSISYRMQYEDYILDENIIYELADFIGFTPNKDLIKSCLSEKLKH